MYEDEVLIAGSSRYTSTLPQVNTLQPYRSGNDVFFIRISLAPTPTTGQITTSAVTTDAPVTTADAPTTNLITSGHFITSGAAISSDEKLSSSSGKE